MKMPNIRDLKFRLQVEELRVRKFRCALADLRQRRYSDSSQNVELDRIVEMQKLCGAIEQSLYSARTKLSELDVLVKNSTGGS